MHHNETFCDLFAHDSGKANLVMMHIFSLLNKAFSAFRTGIISCSMMDKPYVTIESLFLHIMLRHFGIRKSLSLSCFSTICWSIWATVINTLAHSVHSLNSQYASRLLNRKLHTETDKGVYSSLMNFRNVLLFWTP